MRETFQKHFEEPVTKVKEQLKNSYSLQNQDALRIAIIVVKMEVAVYVLQQIKPNDTSLKSIPYLFYSPVFPSSGGPSEVKRQMLQNLRFTYGSKWKIKKVVYQKIDEYKRYQLKYGKVSFHLQFIEDDQFAWKEVAKGGRTADYAVSLANPLKHKKTKPQLATEGSYFFEDKNSKYEVVMPAYMKAGKQAPLKVDNKGKEELVIDRSSLLQASKEMEAIREQKGLSKQNWEDRVKDLDFLDPKNALDAADRIKFKGTQQIVGPLSVGKTTLMQVTAFLLAKQQKVTTLIVKDITEVLHLVDAFHDINVQAVPLISTNQRKQHISQYLASIPSEEKQQLGLDIFNRHAFRYLGKTCLVQGMREEENLYQENPPCFNLQDKNGKRKVCPYIYQCDYHQGFRDLQDGKVIVTTIQSLMSIKMPSAFFDYTMTALEYVIKSSNLIMVDEADRVQHMLDSIMIPSEVIGSSQQNWLADIQEQVHTVLREKTAIMKNKRYISWINNLNFAIACERQIRGFLENEETTNGIKKVIGSQMFTGWKILFTMAKRLSKVKESTEDKQQMFDDISKEFNQFLRIYRSDTYGETVQADSLLLDAVDLITDETKQWFKVSTYVAKLEDSYSVAIPNKDEVINGIIFGLLVCGLEKKLSILTQAYSEVQDELELKGQQNLSLFKGLHEEYEGILPISPTGMQFGFKYQSQEQQDGNGQLTLFRYLAVGRYVLTHMHALYQDIEGQPGAHTILLSGTSYAKGSDRYHVQLPISYVMVNKKQTPPEITYKFHPIWNQKKGRWVKVSGKYDQERKDELKVAVFGLLKEEYIQSLINQLEKGRKRVMIVVGSYEEANMVSSWIHDSNYFNENEVFGLTAEDSKEDHHYKRQLLNAFADGGGKILVVPLLAVERGHNILTLVEGNRVAAFGAAIYLVRPYPVPDDISGMANWLNALSMKDYPNPTYVTDNLYDEFTPLRKKAYQKQYDYFQTTFGYRGLTDFERTNVIMETNTPCHQLEGRLIRGGVPARVIYCDVSFAPLMADGKEETETTSTLIGWRNELNRLVEQKDQVEAKIVDILYGSRIRGLNQLEVE